MGERALTRSERKSTPTTSEVVTKKGKDNRMRTTYSMTPEVEEELTLFVSDWKAELADASGEEEEKRTEQMVKKRERSEMDGAEYRAASKRHRKEDVSGDDDVVYLPTNPCRRPDQPPPKAKRGLAASRPAADEYDPSSSSSSDSSAPKKSPGRRGPGRPRKDHAAGHGGGITKYLTSPVNDNRGTRHRSKDTILIRRPTGMINFGKYKGTPVRDLKNYHIRSIYYMPSTRERHEDVFEDLSAEMDYRVLVHDRIRRQDKFGKRETDLWS